MPEDWQNAGFGLYVHWPFCQSKCPYCDFNSHVTAQVDQKRWAAALVREIERTALETPGRVLKTIFFGGGTPSLMAPETVEAVLDAAKRSWTPANDLEVTLEANPGSVDAGRFAAYAQAGVNRVSMGFQALNDADLRRLGRLHSVKEGLQAFEIAQKSFERTSFDLIYGRQDQSLEDWKSELNQALRVCGDHLSLYQLTIEEGTAFGDRYNAGKLRGLPEEDLANDLYFATQDICSGAGFETYEISNHAKPGQQCRHNLIYWRYGDYVGVGPGAHGRVTLGGQRYATEAHRAPGAWIQAAESGNGECVRDRLSKADQAAEYLMMSLRLSEGTDLERFAALSGEEIPSDRMETLADLGLISVENRRLRATATGRPLLNGLLRELLA